MSVTMGLSRLRGQAAARGIPAGNTEELRTALREGIQELDTLNLQYECVGQLDRVSVRWFHTRSGLGLGDHVWAFVLASASNCSAGLSYHFHLLGPWPRQVNGYAI